MSILTIAQLREHVETDLTEAALLRVLTAAESEVNAKIGLPLIQAEVINDIGLCNILFLRRRASTITTVVEEVATGLGIYDITTLAIDDYKLLTDIQLERLGNGSNPRSRWGDRVSLVYVPKDYNDRRIEVVISLVKLSLQYSGVEHEKVGDWEATMTKYNIKRKEALAQLGGFGFA